MTINCPSCSAPNQEIGKFCENCGYFINEADAKASLAAQAAQPATSGSPAATDPAAAATTSTATADPAPVITPVTGIVPPPASGAAPAGSAQFAIVVAGAADPAKGFTITRAGEYLVGRSYTESNSQADIDAMFDTPAEPTHVTAATEAEPDVFDLTEDMAIAQPPVFQKVEPGQDDLEFEEPAPPPQLSVTPRSPFVERAFREPRESFRPSAPPPEPAPQILSQATVSAVESAFNSLATTVLSNNARTLEDLVKEMLRPMLKSWLDDNLPTMVERIVKAEIERVARGR